jgi:AGZA family xanthine/uracil permease-like MFS transporter
MAYLVMIFGDNLLGSLGKTPDDLASPLGRNLQTLRMLASGFLVTSLLWASALAALVDRRMFAAAGYLLLCGVCSFFGVIHSPLPGSPLAFPWRLGDLPRVAVEQTPLRLAIAYALAALLVALWGCCLPAQVAPPEESGAPDAERPG